MLAQVLIAEADSFVAVWKDLKLPDGRDSEPFDALDRSNTGSAKTTPKSDMAMLTRKQHLASLNWASHLMVDRRLKRPRGCSTVRSLILTGMRPSCCRLPCSSTVTLIRQM
jgi:hypothetical protein